MEPIRVERKMSWMRPRYAGGGLSWETGAEVCVPGCAWIDCGERLSNFESDLRIFRSPGIDGKA
jgi:hypothetical protein